jgi:hypothetical protein
MLRKETVTAATLELLNNLMLDKELDAFYLAGGTALSLQIGHRISVDIDLFSNTSFDQDKISVYLETERKLQLNFLDRNTIKGEINHVQVDLITHAYPLVNPIVSVAGIRLASLEDIAAMKLNAIIGNGSRLKDFVDVAFLSSHLSLERMIAAYEKKYQTRNPVMPLKSLSYFNDINHNEPIQLIGVKYQWDVIEQRLKGMMQSPVNVFPKIPS